MPLFREELQDWLKTLPKRTVVAIDEEGMCLETEGGRNLLEVAPFPVPEGDLDNPSSAPMASYFQPVVGHTYDLTFLGPNQSVARQAKAVRFRRVLANGRYWFVNKDQVWYVLPAHVLACTEVK
jgi:hypothetical protein